jgi:MFS family permease
LGYTSPIGKDLQHALGLTEQQNSFFGALANIGAMFGSLLGGFLADRLGRRLFGCTEFTSIRNYATSEKFNDYAIT